jgi:DNA-binding MarR family transcriptional regulator
VSDERRHPTADLDEVVHQRVRLGILAVLGEADRATFTYLRKTLDTTDGNLSRHLAVLREAGLVELDKGYERSRPRTWVRATAKGRETLAAELRTLRDLVARHERAAGDRGGAAHPRLGTQDPATS